MKKFMFALLAVSLIALTVLPAACSNSTSANGYSTTKLRGMSFSYPSAWKDTSSTMNSMNKDYCSVKAWSNPSYSATLIVEVMDIDKVPGNTLPAVLTTEMKKEMVIDPSIAFTGTGDQITITGQQEISIGGEWAWEEQFTGQREGVASRGYCTTVFHNYKMAYIYCVAQDQDWDSLSIIYERVKDSIAFN
jgi:hypothetical protein